MNLIFIIIIVIINHMPDDNNSEIVKLYVYQIGTSSNLVKQRPVYLQRYPFYTLHLSTTNITLPVNV